MAFTVEDGTGLPDANAYAALEFVNTYHSERGNTKWTGSQSTKEACIVRATDYIDKRFGHRFRGTRQMKEQSLEWPRLGAYDRDDFALDYVPLVLQQATAEYALRALLLGELAPDIPFPTPGQNNSAGATVESDPAGEVKYIKQVVGPVEETKNFLTVGEKTSLIPHTRAPVSSLLSPLSIPEYPAADLLLTRLLKSSGSRRAIRG